MIKQHGQTVRAQAPGRPSEAPLCVHDDATGVTTQNSQSSEHGASDHGVDFLDRLEKPIGNLMRDMARERVEPTQMPPLNQDPELIVV